MTITTKNQTTVLKLRFDGNPCESINDIINNNIMMWSDDRKQMTFVIDPNEERLTTHPRLYQPHRHNEYFFFFWPVTETLFSGEYFLHRVTIRN